jgi:hypothetical protein
VIRWRWSRALLGQRVDGGDAPATPLAALDGLLDHSYAAAFQRLDHLAIFDLSTEALRDRLGPFTNPEESQCRQP